jgi:hypothetical protein
MKRSVRRHRQHVANARRVRILLRHYAWTQRHRWEPKIWQPLRRVVTNEPGWWIHEQVIVMQTLYLQGYDEIQIGIIALLEAARHTAARSINALMTATYWEIGRRIVEFEQGGTERAAYGEALIDRLSEDLTRRFGKGFSRQNLGQMRAFYRAWPTDRICQTVSGKSSHAVLRLQSRELPVKSAVCRSPREIFELAALAKAFPLPWSAYVRLLSVKNQSARRNERRQWHRIAGLFKNENLRDWMRAVRIRRPLPI